MPSRLALKWLLSRNASPTKGDNTLDLGDKGTIVHADRSASFHRTAIWYSARICEVNPYPHIESDDGAIMMVLVLPSGRHRICAFEHLAEYQIHLYNHFPHQIDTL